jgi:nucleotide-binding universal stress UspA family protein
MSGTAGSTRLAVREQDRHATSIPASLLRQCASTSSSRYLFPQRHDNVGTRVANAAHRSTPHTQIRRSTVLAIRRILHPTDFSERCHPAFELACALARDFGAELVVCHVSPPPVLVVGDGAVTEIPTGSAEAMLARLKTVTTADPRVTVTHQLLRGDPAAEIVRLAGDAKIDLVVMGTHGRTGLSRLLMGSVAEQVLRKAPCPVLTVKKPFPVVQPKTPAPEHATCWND